MLHRRVSLVVCLLVAGAAASHAAGRSGQDLPLGQVIQNLPCEADASLGYALYLPSTYSAERKWPLLMGFHYNGLGPDVAQTYRVAAERYGYIVAASNNSRNGNWAASAKVAQAMANDLSERFSVDPTRIYTTGLSGGARLAINIGLTNTAIAGVIASSAGFPDSQPRTSLRFPLFATVGSLDFAYIEMRTLDRTLKTPHRLAVFEGGHDLPPSDVAVQAIEFMELQAMASGLRARDEAFIDRLWDRRERLIAEAGDTPEGVRRLQALAEDFRKLRDVKPVEERSAALAKRADVKTAIERERRSDLAEADLVHAFADLEVGLADPARHDDNMVALRSLLSDLRRTAGSDVQTPERDRARRVLEIVTYAPVGRVQDREYLTLLLSPPKPRK